jgi:hypothetical protein
LVAHCHVFGIPTVYITLRCPELRAKVLVGLPGQRVNPADADAVTELELGSILAKLGDPVDQLVARNNGSPINYDKKYREAA